MNYKFFLLFFILILSGCVKETSVEQIDVQVNKNPFLNKGFALIYNDKLYKEKKIKSKIDDRSLTIFQKNLKKDTTVRVTNLINSKYIIAKVGNDVSYPHFFMKKIANL